MGLFNFGNKKIENRLKNPFLKKKILYICVSMFNHSTSGWDADGKIYFRNGNTRGEQIFKGKTIDDVMEQINHFLDNFDK